MAQIPMTVLGEKMLRDELNQLLTVERPSVITAIAEAREHGDLKENAEYHAAREQQGFIEGRIQDIEAKLSNAQVIDVTKLENTGRVVFGTTVTIVNGDTEEEQTYRIVGEDESDIKAKKISYSAPIARALIGKSVEDEMDFTSPEGKVTNYEIIKVSYLS